MTDASNDERLQKYAEAITDLRYAGKQVTSGHARNLARAVMVVADAELVDLRAVVDALAQQNVDDADRWSEVLSAAEASEALNTTAATAAIEQHQWREVEQRERAEAAEAKLARVKALCDYADRRLDEPRLGTGEIRAALEAGQ